VSSEAKPPSRVLVVDDEADVRDAYRQILLQADVSRDLAAFHDLRTRLFRNADAAPAQPASRGATFDRYSATAPKWRSRRSGSAGRGAAVRGGVSGHAHAARPGWVWAASRIRELDPAIEIVICTAYSDVDPCEIGGIVPPEEKLSYLQSHFTRTRCGR